MCLHLLKQAIVAHEDEIPPPVDEVCARDGYRLCCDRVTRLFWILPEDTWLRPISRMLIGNMVLYYAGPNSPAIDDPDLRAMGI